jgi:hypothetical protein
MTASGASGSPESPVDGVVVGGRRGTERPSSLVVPRAGILRYEVDSGLNFIPIRWWLSRWGLFWNAIG